MLCVCVLYAYLTVSKFTFKLNISCRYWEIRPHLSCGSCNSFLSIKWEQINVVTFLSGYLVFVKMFRFSTWFIEGDHEAANSDWAKEDAQFKLGSGTYGAKHCMWCYVVAYCLCCIEFRNGDIYFKWPSSSNLQALWGTILDQASREDSQPTLQFCQS